MKRIKVFAPASVANVGPGYDILAFALKGIGDTIEARRIVERKVVISSIEGDGGRLKKAPLKNTAGVAALEVLKRLNAKNGVELKLFKNTPLQSGMGSSGVSAAAAAYAVNVLFDQYFSKQELIEPCMLAEVSVSGYHADNVTASLYGGFILIKGYEPLDIIHLGHVKNLYCIIAVPAIDVTTRMARKVVPRNVPVKDWVHNAGHAAAIVAGILLKDKKLIGRSIVDKIVEPARAKLVPGFYDVQKAALESGALGCSLSSAGPSIFALADKEKDCASIGDAMKNAFLKHKVDCKILLTKVSSSGAVILDKE